MTLTDWSSLIGQIGVPIAFCIALLWGIVRVAKWMSPKADELIRAHLDMVRGVRESVRAIEEASKRQATSVEDLSVTLHHHTGVVLANHTRILEGEANLVESQNKIIDNQTKIVDTQGRVVDLQQDIKDLLAEQAKYEKRIEEHHGRQEIREKRREKREEGK